MSMSMSGSRKARRGYRALGGWVGLILGNQRAPGRVWWGFRVSARVCLNVSPVHELDRWIQRTRNQRFAKLILERLTG